MTRASRITVAFGAAVLTASYSPLAVANGLVDVEGSASSEVELGTFETKTDHDDVSPPKPARPAQVPPPRWSGNTLLVTGTITAGVGMALHGLAAYGLHRKCFVVENPGDLLPSQLQAVGLDSVLDSTFLSNIDVMCSPSVALALGARVLVPIFSAGALAQIAVGGAFRGDRVAYDDAVLNGRRRSGLWLAGFGGALMIGGAALWVGSRASMYENRTGCDDIDCVAWYDFGTYQGSSIMFIAGSGMLARGLAYRNSRSRYERWANVDIQPMISRQQAGLLLQGSF